MARTGVDEATKAEVETLIARVAMGDRAAFETLYDLTAPKLLGVALRVMDDRNSAEAVLRDTYVKVWHGADRYVAGRTRPLSWMISLARNTAIDRRRKGQADKDQAQIGAAAALLAEQELEPLTAEQVTGFEASFSDLSEDRQAAVRQIFLEGDGYSKVARDQSIPLATVRSWLRESLAFVRAGLL